MANRRNWASGVESGVALLEGVQKKEAQIIQYADRGR